MWRWRVNCHVGKVAVEAAVGQDRGAIDCDSLGLVDGRGVAVIEATVKPRIQLDGPARVEPDPEASGFGFEERAEDTVLDASTLAFDGPDMAAGVVVAEKQHAIAR